MQGIGPPWPWRLQGWALDFRVSIFVRRRVGLEPYPSKPLCPPHKLDVLKTRGFVYAKRLISTKACVWSRRNAQLLPNSYPRAPKRSPRAPKRVLLQNPRLRTQNPRVRIYPYGSHVYLFLLEMNTFKMRGGPHFESVHFLSRIRENA